MLLSQNRYYQFVREERLFCAALAHLLLQQGANLQAFIELINTKLTDSQLATVALEHSEVYVEFAYLRDYWNRLGRDNGAKRDFIFDRLARVDLLSGCHSADFPSTIPEFNEFFMGRRGKVINNDIVYPGQWSVTTLSERFGQQSENGKFQDFCRFKWAFNIKPDLVVLTPGSRPLCIEAKLESREGWYPTSDREAKIFDDRFGPEQGRVRQLEEQSFMFDRLLGSPCQLVVIGRDSEGFPDVPFLSWAKVFKKLDKDASIPFVRKLIEENVPLNVPGH